MHEPARSALPGRRSVIHVINGEHYSGAERVQDLLAQRLPEFGYGVEFACVKPGRFDAMRSCRDAPLHELSMRLRVDMRPALSLARIVRQSDAVLLHAHTPRSLMIARVAAMITHIPLIYHVHSPTSRDSTRPVQNWINNATELFSLHGVDRLVAVSESLAGHMREEGIAAERIVTIPNGVPSAGPLQDRPAPDAAWTVGTVALMRPRKGLEVLLEAIAQLRERKLDVRLRVVGCFETAEYEREIHAMCDRLGIARWIEWVGFTRDVVGELFRMDLFALPSLFGEGLPMVVLEAMAAGVPVVSSRVEGVPEAIRDGQDGLLVTPGSVDELQRAAATIIDDPRLWQRLRGEAYRRHAEHFSDRRMAEQLARLYDTVLKQHAAAPASPSRAGV